MPNLNILISGAGIAGPVVAFWLAKSGAKVTLVERATELRTGGQNIDVRGHALEVVKRMGLDEVVRSHTTQEKGLRFVDSSNACRAEFPVEDGEGFTAEIEIMRGDLAKIFYDATRDHVEYIFNDSISSIREDSTAVFVEFKSAKSPREFDLLIAADGWNSSTRRLSFDATAASDFIKPLGQWAGWCTIPRESTDDYWARWYNAPGGRMILIRPDNTAKLSRVSLWIMSEDPRLDAVVRKSASEQQDLFSSLFADAGWEAPRVVKAMEHADDFYVQKIAQVKPPTSWFQGRTVLLGDAGYCPSPISGMGTTVAIVGAYVLAGEITKHITSSTPSSESNRDVLESAFREYERKMTPFITKAQQLAPGTPSLANPQTAWGIMVLHWILGLVAWSRLHRLFGNGWNPPATAMDLPDYQM